MSPMEQEHLLPGERKALAKPGASRAGTPDKCGNTIYMGSERQSISSQARATLTGGTQWLLGYATPLIWTTRETGNSFPTKGDWLQEGRVHSTHNAPTKNSIWHTVQNSATCCKTKHRFLVLKAIVWKQVGRPRKVLEALPLYMPPIIFR